MMVTNSVASHTSRQFPSILVIHVLLAKMMVAGSVARFDAWSFGRWIREPVAFVARNAFAHDIGKLDQGALGRAAAFCVGRDGVEIAVHAESEGLELQGQLAHDR